MSYGERGVLLYNRVFGIMHGRCKSRADQMHRCMRSMGTGGGDHVQNTSLIGRRVRHVTRRLSFAPCDIDSIVPGSRRRQRNECRTNTPLRYICVLILRATLSDRLYSCYCPPWASTYRRSYEVHTYVIKIVRTPVCGTYVLVIFY